MTYADDYDSTEQCAIEMATADLEHDCKQLREQVTTLEGQLRASKDWSSRCLDRADALAAERDEARATIATLTAEREHFRKRLVETDTEASEARADVERLTKEVEKERTDHVDTRKHWGGVVDRFKADNARHLAVIETLRAFARQVRDLWDHDEDAHRYGTSCRCCDADAVHAKTAPEYAKKADEVEVEDEGDLILCCDGCGWPIRDTGVRCGSHGACAKNRTTR